MKIAIQFSGQLRNFIQPYQFFKRNLLDLIDCDVFLSTWSSMPSQLFNDDLQDCQDNIDEFITLYNPVDVATLPLTKSFLQSHIDLAYKGNINHDYIVKVEYLWYGLFQKLWCNRFRQAYEKKHNIKYDIIFVTRPDLVLGEPFPTHLIPHAKDQLLIPAGSDWLWGKNDLLVLGGDEHITQYCTLFLKCADYIKNRVVVHPEHLLKYHLDEFAVPVKRFSYLTHLRSRRMT